MGNSEKVKIVLYIEIGLYVISIIIIAAVLVFSGNLEEFVLKNFIGEEPNKHSKEVLRTIFLIVIVIVGFSMLVSLILLYLLYAGHKQGNICKLKTWFILGCIGATLMILLIITSIANNPKIFVMQIPNIVYAGYRIWALICVKGFMNEIQSGPSQSPFQAVAYSNA